VVASAVRIEACRTQDCATILMRNCYSEMNGM
jgi:hypothetical protein